MRGISHLTGLKRPHVNSQSRSCNIKIIQCIFVKVDDEIFTIYLNVRFQCRYPSSHSWLEFFEWNMEWKVLYNSSRCFDRTCFTNEFGNVYSVCNPLFSRPHCCRNLSHSWCWVVTAVRTEKKTQEITQQTLPVVSHLFQLIKLDCTWFENTALRYFYRY